MFSLVKVDPSRPLRSITTTTSPTHHISPLFCFPTTFITPFRISDSYYSFNFHFNFNFFYIILIFTFRFRALIHAMTAPTPKFSSIFTSSSQSDSVHRPPANLGFTKFPATSPKCRRNMTSALKNLAAIRATEGPRMPSHVVADEVKSNGCAVTNDADESNGSIVVETSMNGSTRSTNVVWHKCSVEKVDRQELLQQRGCVIWITGLSGSGKSTVACALTKALHARGKLTYILDGDNVRHGLNSDLTFKPEDRVENIRRVGEVAKLFADAGIICIASVISPYRKDRDACRSMLPDGDFIEVFMDIPLSVCEARDPKGLYKLARAGKIKGFTGIDDPYETPLNSEVVLQQEGKVCPPPEAMAEKVISYMEANGYLQA